VLGRRWYIDNSMTPSFDMNSKSYALKCGNCSVSALVYTLILEK
jgi:hypothetical protein